MTDLTPILRRRLGDPLPALESSLRDCSLLGRDAGRDSGLPRDLRDLCPELQDTFRRAMGPAPLPLRLREDPKEGPGARRRESLSIEQPRGDLLPALDEVLDLT